jgi:hypothetical protein
MVIPKIAVTIKYPLFWSKTIFFLEYFAGKRRKRYTGIVHLQKPIQLADIFFLFRWQLPYPLTKVGSGQCKEPFCMILHFLLMCF